MLNAVYSMVSAQLHVVCVIVLQSSQCGVGNVARCVCRHGVCSNCMWFVCFINNIRLLGLFPDLFADDSVDADDNYLLHPDVSRLPYPLRLLSCVLCMPWCQLELHVVCVVDSQSSHSGTS